ncbi:MAG TPA: hypothetical protein VGH40_05720 [Roseiarcus sp.]
MFRLEEKLARIRAGSYRRSDFVIADAKDPDMGPGLNAIGPARQREGSAPRLRTRAEFIDSIEAVIRQDVVDVMLTSASNLELLTRRGAFAGSRVKPAIRANDTTDIWRLRGANYAATPSRPFRTASLSRVRSGTPAPRPDLPVALTDLGLYSVTFTGEVEQDVAALEAFGDFRADAAANDFRYFLEVFNPNAGGIAPQDVPLFVNDAIVRCLAGLTEAERPRFLKIVYNGPRALDELASFDPGLVVGVLGGGAGTTRDCFELLHQAEKYGARVALFGRKINLAESPLDIVRFLRAVADGDLQPAEAVKAYHDGLRRDGVKPVRDLAADNEITETVLKQS